MSSTRFLNRLGAALLLLVSLSTGAPAQDPAVVNAKTISVKLDNDRVRVFEAILQPGAKEQLHSHPAYVFYVVESGKMRNPSVYGEMTESDLKTGEVFYRDR